MTRRRVGILVFPDVEVLDFCGPFEVFATTRLDEDRRREEPSPYEVLLIAEGSGVIVTSGGLRVYPIRGRQAATGLGYRNSASTSEGSSRWSINWIMASLINASEDSTLFSRSLLNRRQ